MLALSQGDRDRLHVLNHVHERGHTVSESAREGVGQRQMRRLPVLVNEPVEPEPHRVRRRPGTVHYFDMPHIEIVAVQRKVTSLLPSW